MASKKPLPAARKPLPTTKKPSQEITAGSVGADIAKQKYDILLADMQRRAQLGQFDPAITQSSEAQKDLQLKLLQNYQSQTYPNQQTNILGFGDVARQQAANASIPNPRYGIDFIEGGPRYQPMMPAPGQVAQQPVPTQQIPSNQQAMQNYQNLLTQGLANYQAQTYPGQSQFGSMARPAQTSPQRKPSTPGFPTPKPFG